MAAALFAVVPASCGDDDPKAEPPRRAATVVASLGDSITAGTPLWDPDPAMREQLPQIDRRSEYGYWAERERPGTEYRNCGVPGERTDEIALRVGDCARGADALIVQGGVNDLSQGIEPAAVARNLRAMVRRGRQLGLDVAIVEVLPWNGGYPDYADEVRELNRRIAGIAHEEGAELIPWYRVLEDPAKPGRMRLDLTVDLAHPTVKGYRLLGEAVDFP